MRTILALAILLLGLSSAAPEPEYSSSLPFNSFRLVEGNSPTSLVEIESSIGKGDRLVVAALPSPAQPAELQLTAAPQIPARAEPTSPTAADAKYRDADFARRSLQRALHVGARQSFAGHFLRQSDLAGERAAEGHRQPKGRHGHRPIHAADRGRKRPRRPVRSFAVDLRFGAAPARTARPIRQPRLRRRRLQCGPAAGERLARAPSADCRAKPLSYVLNVTGRSVEQWQKTPPDDADVALRAAPAVPRYVGLRRTGTSAIAADAGRPNARSTDRRRHARRDGHDGA